jgi:hypothetical protein
MTTAAILENQLRTNIRRYKVRAVSRSQDEDQHLESTVDGRQHHVPDPTIPAVLSPTNRAGQQSTTRPSPPGSVGRLPGQALVAKLQNLFHRRMMRTRAATHGDPGLAKLMGHRGPGNTQLGTDLALGPTPGVQVGCTLNVHGG